MYDLLIQNGTVVDGTGNARYRADVAVKDGRIARIAPKISEEAARVIDAAGRIVSPGFVDYHSHSDETVLTGAYGYNFLEQGVTTQICGQCGSTPAPYYEGVLDGLRLHYSEEEHRAMREACRTPRTFMEHAEKQTYATNMAFYAGHSALRASAVYFSDKVPDERELDIMRGHLREAMECGYLGYTSGLVYPPSEYGKTPELIELAKVAAAYGGSYASHIRNEGDRVLEAVAEAIEVGRKAGLPVIVSHLKVMGKHNEGTSEKILRMIEDANAEGIKVRADQYPYLAGSAPFVSKIPSKYHTDGIEKLIARMADKGFRETLRAELNADDVGASLISGCPLTPQYVGMTVAQIAAQRGVDITDAACDLLYDNKGSVQGIYFTQNESDMLRILAHPYVMSGSDWSDYGDRVDSETVGGTHPRGTSTAVRRLELARDHGLRTLESVVHSMTGLPAEMSTLRDIGVLREGARADLCVFDYAAIRTASDYVHPHRRNEGIEYVVVGGAVAVEHGLANGERHGVVLKRGQ